MRKINTWMSLEDVPKICLPARQDVQGRPVQKDKPYYVVLEIKHRQLRWFGHVLRLDQDGIPKVALRWNPPKKRQGRPKTTKQRVVTSELSWGEDSVLDRTELCLRAQFCGLNSNLCRCYSNIIRFFP